MFGSNGHFLASLPATAPGCDVVTADGPPLCATLMDAAKFDEGEFGAFPDDIPEEDRKDASVGCAVVSPHYLRLLSMLPGARIRNPKAPDEPIAIKFDGGGLALLMPRRKEKQGT